MTTTEEIMAPGVPHLLETLSTLLGESVYLWYTPPPAGDDVRWRVWTGAPTGTNGGEWGRGSTPYRALHMAYMSIIEGIFVGRVTKKESVEDENYVGTGGHSL